MTLKESHPNPRPTEAATGASTGMVAKPRVPVRRAPAGDGTDNQQRLLPACDHLWQSLLHRLMRPVLRANKETQKCPAPQRPMVPNRSLQSRIPRLQCIQYRPDGNHPSYLQRNLAAHAGKVPQMLRQLHPYLAHGKVCTSTESTAGRSRTIGAHVSPASADAYTCPPVVPK